MTSVTERPTAAPALSPVGRVRLVVSDSLYRNSLMLMANTAASTVLGAVFWLVAARRYNTDQVGILLASLSTTVLLGTVASLGLPNSVVRFLPRRPERSGELTVTAATLTSALAAVLFVATAKTPWAIPLLRGRPSFTLALLGLGLVVLSAAAMTMDSTFIAQRSAHLLLLKNVAGGVVKVVAVAVLPGSGLASLTASILLGVAVSGALTVVLMAPRVSRPLLVSLSSLDGAWSFSLGNHAGMIFGILPTTATPLIVLSALGADKAAFFGVAMMLMGILTVIPSTFSQSLFAELSSAPETRWRQIRRAARATYLLLVPAVAVVLVAASLLLRAFGHAYAAGGAACLRWLALGALVSGANYLVDVIVNSRGHAGSYLFLNASNALMVLGCVAVAAPHGLAAVGVGWLVAQALSVAVALGYLQLSRYREQPEPYPAATLPARPTLPVQPTRPVRPLEPAPAAGSLGAAYAKRGNSLNFLRLLFALLVIVGHSPHLGFNSGAPHLGSFYVQDAAVDGFFIISGFLITTSRLRSSSGANYLWKRCLRILPGYWACLVVTAFGLAPLLYWRQHAGFSGFFRQPGGPLGYVTRQAFLVQGQTGISGVLPHANVPYVLNGSLWTLLYEFLAYLGLAVLAALGLLRLRSRVVPALTVVCLAGLTWLTLDPAGFMAATHSPELMPRTVRLGAMFLAGASLRLWHHKVPMSSRLAIACAAVVLAAAATKDWQIVGAVPFAYLVLFVGARLRLLHAVGTRNDLSYGIYLYAWPIQQSLTNLHGSRLGQAGYTLVTMVLAAGCAFLSWRLVEAPALRLKSLQRRRSRIPVAESAVPLAAES
jgi:peptidoglycan/LPS O-acetylase OafA/YrhL/O-antigen/teichoic acid export membrane protein